MRGRDIPKSNLDKNKRMFTSSIPEKKRKYAEHQTDKNRVKRRKKNPAIFWYLLKMRIPEMLEKTTEKR